MSRHRGQENVWRCTQALHAHGLALEIRDAANALVAE